MQHDDPISGDIRVANSREALVSVHRGPAHDSGRDRRVMTADGAAGEDRLRELMAINRAIAGSLDYDEVLHLVVEKTAAFTGASACLLLMCDADGIARVVASVGEPQNAIARFRAPMDEHIESKQRALLNLGPADQLVSVPVMAGRRLRGLLTVCCKAIDHHADDQEQLILALADQAAIALDHAARYSEVRRDLRSRELLTEHVFDHAPLGIYALTPDLVVEEVNAAGAEFVGRSDHGLVGRPLGAVLPDASGHVAGCCRMILSGAYESVSGIQVHIEPGWGAQERYLDVSLVQGAPRGVLLLAWDITERVRAERKQELHAEQLAEANEAKDLFFNTLSHELRTPLAAMANSLAVLNLAGATAEQRRSARQIMERNVRSQARLVDDLLDLSRIMRGKLKLDQQPLDLRDIVDSQARELEGDVRAAAVRLSCEQAASPLTISADPLRLRQIIANLLVNAIKYTNPGGQITVVTAAEDGEAVLRVRDTGVGITPQLMRHLFEPFRQAEHSGARSRGGLGIGLSIARALAEQHGGRLGASSPGANQGSEFTLRLPRAHAVRPGPEDAAAAANMQPRRVLVVEDDADVRDSLVVLLQVLGHTVFSCADGVCAVETAERERPDVGLIDLGMPYPDGYEVARRLRDREWSRGMRLIALTGYSGEEHVQKAAAAGFDAHVTKPVTPDRLADILLQAPGQPFPPC